MGILDADKEGFLRAHRSLIQTFGRAARNADGRVILYGDKITDSMRVAMEETERRRKVQGEYNAAHGITPKTILKPVKELDYASGESRELPNDYEKWVFEEGVSPKEVQGRVDAMRREMFAAAKERQFEQAALLRDRIQAIEQATLLTGG